MNHKFEKLLNQLVKLHPKYIDLSLERILNLLNKIDDPHLRLPPVIHIAGTNGKGSTLSFIHHILQENHYSVHCYISPHLKSFEERFIVSNKQVTKQKLFKALTFIKKVNAGKPITFFEITTAAAFYLFAREKADFTILETGLGGRLDATNIIKKSIIDIITPISIDHREFLGNSIKKITNEKLGIIKSSSKIIISKQNINVKNYITKKIKHLKNKKFFFGQQFNVIRNTEKLFFLKYNNDVFKFNKPLLNGKHQIENAATALITIMQIKDLGYKISLKLANRGLRKTTFAGRLERGQLNHIPVYLDGAHNIDGAEKLADFFKDYSINRWLIIGMLNNKDLNKYLLKLKKIFSGVVAIRIPEVKNSFLSDEIFNMCKIIGMKCIKKRNIIEANTYLLSKVKPQEIVVSGSLYLVGKVRSLYV